ncbi:MAG: class I SAM-dependent rRNA methyltransferase [Christensenellaceae bacterium]|jgi:23S rRNA (cytosine1962-C5)-methyltransferase|nr:class I SAM-dependent rRNA methyltransferase [Christensenellaceae bacterium]
MYTVILKRSEDKRILAGHPWVYANEVSKIEGKDVPGSVCRVESFDRRFIGLGFINHLSKIIVRMISYNDIQIDQKFFENRIRQANQFRIDLGFKDCYRVVFSESDYLPGLIIDKFSDHLVIQLLSLCMDKRKSMIVDILKEVFSPACIVERSDSSIRLKEGLKEIKGVLWGALNENLIISENNIKFKINLLDGQKTGFFLDQKINREKLMRFAKGKTILDAFCNQGGFSLCAAASGANEITAVDIDDKALSSLKHNALINSISNITCIEADVFDFLRKSKREGVKYDVIILDPPGFIKSKDKIKEGYAGYKDINILAMKLLTHGGILLTYSCSQHMTPTLFINMLKESAVHAGVTARLIDYGTQAPDHAPLIALDESLYLKSAILKIDK